MIKLPFSLSLLYIPVFLFSQNGLDKAFTFEEVKYNCELNHRTVEKIKVAGNSIQDHLKKFSGKIQRNCTPRGDRNFKIRNQIRYVVIEGYSGTYLPKYLDNFRNITALEIIGGSKYVASNTFRKITASYISRDSIENLGNIASLTFKNMEIDIHDRDTIPAEVEAINFIDIHNLQSEIEDVIALINRSSGIKYLSIDLCHLDYIPTITNSNIISISLKKNNLSMVPDIKNPAVIKYLDLSGNPITSFDNLEYFKNIVVLDISSTQITSSELSEYVKQNELKSHFEKMKTFIFENLPYTADLAQHCENLHIIVQRLRGRIKYISYLYIDSVNFRLRKQTCDICFDHNHFEATDATPRVGKGIFRKSGK